MLKLIKVTRNLTIDSMKHINYCLKGFILKEYLLSLVIMMILLPIVISSLQIVGRYDVYDERVQDEIAIAQLRDKLLLGMDFVIMDSDLEYRIGTEKWCLHAQNERLYLTPGYQLFLDNVKGCYFKQLGNTIYIEYQKDNINYVWAIAKV